MDGETTIHTPSDSLDKSPLAKEPVDVYIRTARVEIEAVAHLFAGARFTDYLNRPDVQFLPLTEATVRDDGTGQTTRYPFLTLNKNEIIFLAPLHE